MHGIVGALVAAAVAAPGGTSPRAVTDLQQGIYDKLDYDLEYFGNIMRLQRAGKRDHKLSPAKFAHEVKRARANLPVLRAYKAGKGTFASGRPFLLPKKPDEHRVYTNLLAILNLTQAFSEARYDDALRWGQHAVIAEREDWGEISGTSPDHYVRLYREYFYMMAAASFRLGKDAAAVQWFSRVQSDADLQAMRQAVAEPAAKKEPKARVLDRLRLRPVAVAPFDNLVEDKESDWMSRALMEILTADLARHSDLHVLERAQIDKVVGEIGLGQLGVTAQESAAKMGEMLGAASLLVGSYRQQGDKVELWIRLVDVASNEALAARSGNVDADAVFAGARSVLLALLTDVGWLDEQGMSEAMATRAAQPGVVRDLMKARMLKATQSKEARELYAKAAREDPAYARLFDDLAAEFSDVTATAAVLSFVNASADPKDAWMVRGVEESLMSDLPRLRFTVVERDRLQALIKEHAALANASDLLNTDTAREVGQYAAADFIVMGSFLRQGMGLRIDARFVEVRTGIAMLTASVEDPAGEYMPLLGKLTQEIANQLNEQLSEDTLAELMGKKPDQAELEKLARQELAKDSLVTAVNKRATPEAPSRWPFWLAVGGAGAGAALSVIGLAVADSHSDDTAYTFAQAEAEQRPDEREALIKERNAHASKAQTWEAVGYVGLGVAALSVVYLLLDELWLRAPAEASVSPTADVGATGEVRIGLQGRF